MSHYTVEVEPADRPPGHFRWKIRDQGRLIERSMGAFPTRQAAEQAGTKAAERIQHGLHRDGKRR